ncbi:diacylglycerol acyltransferase-domain-containing protein [Pisolithus orientalis]|uniref:diacylglycerol acyltransferase-domain-containing protein n=1 Tax=Pisolithus orientalis TaxID=936130 RepID=UPI002224AF20|nr:diacylglycerol acyltransferase-domain-containing protein [Pisolithus orientalis]KAI6006676.1 diacylglycerol acyltransferase-domain-containing protein [Pisolithus orientalis]
MEGRVITRSPSTFSASALPTSPLRPVVSLHASIDFVPAKIPRKRRLQTLAVAVWSTVIIISVSLFLYLCSIPALWPLIAVYLIWMSWIDKTHGSASLKLWRYFAEYYPASCAECDLPPDRPYVFGYHPHATGFSAAFPGIRPHLLTLTNNFDVPVYREILAALGISSVSKQSCSNILKRGPGEAITIVVGGAAESLSARPGTADLTLRRSADLVPVFSFGENDIYQQMANERGTTIYALQKRFQKMFGFTLPLFHGRGLMNYNLGLLPYRRRIVSVIGCPIHIEKCEKPSLEEVTRVQTKYIEEITRIWNTYKDEFAKTRKRELSIID